MLVIEFVMEFVPVISIYRKIISLDVFILMEEEIPTALKKGSSGADYL